MEYENKTNIESDLREIKETLSRVVSEMSRQSERLSVLEDGVTRHTVPDALMKSMMGEGIKSPIGINIPPPPPPPPPHSSPSTSYTGQVHQQEKREWVKKPEELVVLKKEDHRDFEEKMGVTWFSRVGILALVFGVSFFLKYAFDSNWIGPTGRVMIGVFAGISLLGLGEKFIKKYFDYAQILSAGGISILYLSLYSALNFYHLVSQVTAFGYMALVTIIGGLLSVRYNAKSLMVFTVLGGFLTPVLVSSGTNQQFEFFSYLLILDVGIFGVSLFKRWHDVQFIGFLCTLIAFSGWSSSYYTVDQLWQTFVFATLFFLVYSISALGYNLINKEESTGMEQTLALFAGIVYFATSYGLLDTKYHAYMGFFAFVLAIYHFLFANIVKAITPKDSMLYNFLALLSVGFITLAIPLQFKTNVITLCWLVEGVLLTYAAISSKNYILKQFSIVVTLLPVARLFFMDFDMAKTGMFILNERFFTYLFGIVALYIIGYLWHQDTESSESRTLANVSTLTANFFTLMAGSLEIMYHFEKIKNIPLSSIHEQITLSIYWLSYAFIILTIGIFGKLRHIRLFGYILLVLALIKFTFADLWRIRDLVIAERIGMYAFIIAVLYGTAYLWNEYKEDIVQAKKLVAVFAVLANLFTLYAGSMEISYHYNDLIKVEQAKISQNYENNNWNGSQNYNASAEYKQIEKLNNKESVTLSIFWIIYAVFLLAVGIVRKIRYVRLFGLFLLSFAILKLFLYDLWGLGTLYRIISSMTLGVVLLAVSYAYQRFKDQIKTII